VYNYYYNVEVIRIDCMDVGAVPTTSTINRFHYGGELGSTAIQRVMELSGCKLG